MRKFLAILLSIIFVLTLLISIIFSSIDRHLFNPATYKAVLTGQQIYARFPRIIAEQLTVAMHYDPCAENPFICESASTEFKDCSILKLGQERFQQLAAKETTPNINDLNAIQPCLEQYPPETDAGTAGGPPPFMQVLTITDWESILADILPESILKPIMEDLIDGIFAYLNGNQDTVSISFMPLKNHLTGQGGVETVLNLIRAQPPCSADEAAAMVESIRANTAPDSFCSLPEESLQTLKPDIKAMLRQYIGTIPDYNEILNPGSGENSDSTGPLGGGLVGAYRAVRFILRLSPEVPLACLLIITLLMVREPRSWLRWWGIPLVITGLLSAILVILGLVFFDKSSINILTSMIPAYLSLGIVELLRGLLTAVVRRLLFGILTGALLFGIPGLIMWVASYFLGKKNQT